MGRRKADRRFEGQTLTFFGTFSFWPAYHGAPPREVARRLGATVVETLDEGVDVLVLGDLRGSGRAEAKKKAERLAKAPGASLKVIDESAYRELVRRDMRKRSFFFAGSFDCSPDGHELLAGMVEGVGGTVAAAVDTDLDYLVVGNRRGPGKVATQNQVSRLVAEGADILALDETAFLELVRAEAPKRGQPVVFSVFLTQLYGTVDEAKVGRALKMLQTDAFKLYARLDDACLVGVVRSQTGSGSVYASWLRPDGRYGCSQADLADCMGLQGSPCKHLLVLLIGLARTSQMPIASALAWIRAVRGKRPKTDRDLCAETFILYKGAEAGEVDWRPTETIPEDYYAL